MYNTLNRRATIGAGIGGLFLIGMIWMILFPFAVIWAVNTLFALGIAYTFWTWLAVLILSFAFGNSKQNFSKN